LLIRSLKNNGLSVEKVARAPCIEPKALVVDKKNRAPFLF